VDTWSKAFGAAAPEVAWAKAGSETISASNRPRAMLHSTEPVTTSERFMA
jgi:hypothetical protein